MRWPFALSKQGADRDYIPLLSSIFVIATCAIIYELMIGAVSSYLLGDSIFQFSVTIGLFLTAMGVGSFLSRRLEGDLLTVFVNVEVIIGIVGGFSVPFLFYVYGSSPGSYRPVQYLVIGTIGILVGLEIPLLARLLADRFALRANLANVLSLDYLGGLIGSLLFPLVLLPWLGIVPTSLFVGLVNLAVAYVTILAFRYRLPDRRVQSSVAIVAGVLLLFAFVQSGPLWGYLEQRLYRDSVLLSTQTRYQHITITRWNEDVRLFLDGNLQFSSLDEYRYHETLVHPPMSLLHSRSEILILGGGDGLAAREILKYGDVRRVTLVDLDPEIVALARTDPTLAGLNDGSLSHPKLRAVYQDAFKFIEEDGGLYNLIVADLPDPRNEGLQKLFSAEFYRMVARRLAAGGVFVTQATSPYFARNAYWSIVSTLRTAFPSVLPYHTEVPSFGDWGFAMASTGPLAADDVSLTVQTRYLNPSLLPGLFAFGKDVADPGNLHSNSILRPILLEYYREGWRGTGGR